MVMKKFLPTILLTTAMLLLFSSCGPDNKTLEAMVPKSSETVVCFKVPQLVEKSGLFSGDDIVLPDSLKQLLRQNDEAFVSRAVKALPQLGVMIKNNIYVFAPKSKLNLATVLSVENADKAVAALEHMNGAKFEEADGLRFLIADTGVVYAINDNVLCAGWLANGVSGDDGLKEIKGYFSQKGNSIADDADILKSLQREGDVVGYACLKNVSRFTEGVPGSIGTEISSIMTEMVGALKDVKAEFAVTFNGSKADMVATISGGKAVDAVKSVLSKPSNAVLRTIPNTMASILSVSVSGEQLLKLPSVSGLVAMAKAFSFTSNLDLEQLIGEIEGPIVMGIAPDSYFSNDYNYAFAVGSRNPHDLMNKVGEFATMMGQEPDVVGPEHIYGLYNKQVKVGVEGNSVYAKMLNYEQTEGNADEIAPAMELLGKYPLALFQNSRLGYFTLGFDNNLEGTGCYAAKDENANAIAQLLMLACSIKPQPKPKEEKSDDVEYAPMPTAIDQLTEF